MLLVPPALRRPPRLFRVLRRGLQIARARLADTNECPVCGRRCRFEAFGDPPRPKACCPGCDALERHRLLWLYLSRELFAESKRAYRILHCAPEPCLSQQLRSLPGVQYVSMDFSAHNVSVKTDITALAFRDNSFDLVICNHVFEHIPDDRAAMRELFRVCKVDGIALLTVPYDPALDRTCEDWSITTPEARSKAFGQFDHVRTYSPGDYARRLSDAGLDGYPTALYRSIQRRGGVAVRAAPGLSKDDFPM